jgi:hypothetical protein
MNTHYQQRLSTTRPAVAAWSTSGHDAPVFVDDSGRRAHGVHLAGFAIAMLCACWLATLVLGVSGVTSLPGAHASTFARALPTRAGVLDIEPVLGAKLQWADDAPVANSGRSLALVVGGRLRE